MDAVVSSHLLELVDHSIFQGQFPQIVGVRTILVEHAADVVRLDWAGVGAHGNALVVDSLLVDPRRKEHV